MIKCKHCGTENPVQGNFCQQCGYKLKSDNVIEIRQVGGNKADIYPDQHVSSIETVSKQQIYSTDKIREVGETAAGVGCMGLSCLMQLFIFGAMASLAIAFFKFVMRIF